MGLFDLTPGPRSPKSPLYKGGEGVLGNDAIQANKATAEAFQQSATAEPFRALYDKMAANPTIKVPDFETFRTRYSNEEGMNILWGRLSNNPTVKLPSLRDFKDKYSPAVTEAGILSKAWKAVSGVGSGWEYLIRTDKNYEDEETAAKKAAALYTGITKNLTASEIATERAKQKEIDKTPDALISGVMLGTGPKGATTTDQFGNYKLPNTGNQVADIAAHTAAQAATKRAQDLVLKSGYTFDPKTGQYVAGDPIVPLEDLQKEYSQVYLDLQKTEAAERAASIKKNSDRWEEASMNSPTLLHRVWRLTNALFDDPAEEDKERLDKMNKTMADIKSLGLGIVQRKQREPDMEIAKAAFLPSGANLQDAEQVKSISNNIDLSTNALKKKHQTIQTDPNWINSQVIDGVDQRQAVDDHANKAFKNQLLDNSMRALDKETFIVQSANSYKNFLQSTRYDSNKQLEQIDKDINGLINLTKGTRLTDQGEEYLKTLQGLRIKLKDNLTAQDGVIEALNTKIGDNSTVLASNNAQKFLIDKQYDDNNWSLAPVDRFITGQSDKIARTVEHFDNAFSNKGYRGQREEETAAEYVPLELRLAKEESLKIDTGKDAEGKNLWERIHVNKLGLFHTAIEQAVISAELGIAGSVTLGSGAALLGGAARLAAGARIAQLASLSSSGSKAAQFALWSGRGLKGVLGGAIDTGTGFIAPSILLFSAENIEAEMKNGRSAEDAIRIGVVRAGIEGLTERINPFEMNLLRGRVLTGVTKNLGEDVIFKNLTAKNGLSKRAFDYIYGTGKGAARAAGTFAKEGLKQINMEAIEEDMGLFLNNMLSKSIQKGKVPFGFIEGDATYKNEEPFNLQNLVNTHVLTMATMAGHAVIGGGYKAVKEWSGAEALKNARFMVANSPDLYKSVIAEKLVKGLITKDEAVEAIDRVDALHDTLVSPVIKAEVDVIMADNTLSKIKKNEKVSALFDANYEFQNHAKIVANLSPEERSETLSTINDELFDALKKEKREVVEAKWRSKDVAEFDNPKVAALVSAMDQEKQSTAALDAEFSAERINKLTDLEPLKVTDQQTGAPIDTLSINGLLTKLKARLTNLEGKREEDQPFNYMEKLKTIIQNLEVRKRAVEAGGTSEISKSNPQFLETDVPEPVVPTAAPVVPPIAPPVVPPVVTLPPIVAPPPPPAGVVAPAITIAPVVTAEEEAEEEEPDTSGEAMPNEAALREMHAKHYEGKRAKSFESWLNTKAGKKAVASLNRTKEVSPEREAQIEKEGAIKTPASDNNTSDEDIHSDNVTTISRLGAIYEDEDGNFRTDDGDGGYVDLYDDRATNIVSMMAWRSREFSEDPVKKEESNTLNAKFDPILAPNGLLPGTTLLARVNPGLEFVADAKKALAANKAELVANAPDDKKEAFALEIDRDIKELDDNTNFVQLDVFTETGVNPIASIHLLSYINSARVFPEVYNIKGELVEAHNLYKNYQELKAYRASIFAAIGKGEVAKLEVIAKGNGYIFAEKDKKSQSTTDALKNKDVLNTIQVSKEQPSQLALGDKLSINKAVPGGTYILIPTGNGSLFAWQLNAKRASQEVVDSYMAAIDFFEAFQSASLDVRNKVLLPFIEDMPWDISTIGGLREYLNNLIPSSSLTSIYTEDFGSRDTQNTFDKMFIDIQEAETKLTFSTTRFVPDEYTANPTPNLESTLYEKAGIYRIDLKKPLDPKLRDLLREHLMKRRVATNFTSYTDHKDSDFSLPLITVDNGKFGRVKESDSKQKYTSYKQYLKENTTTTLLEHKTSTGAHAYFSQPSLRAKVEEVKPPVPPTETEAREAEIEGLKKEKSEALKPLIAEKKKIEKEIEEIEKGGIQGAYDFSASSNNGKWNSANNDLESLVQNHRKAFSFYKLLIGDVQSFKELVDIINEKTDANIEYTNSMKRADETMSAEEIQSAIDSYNESSNTKKEDKTQVEKDILSENNLKDETEYAAEELIEKFPLKGVQKVIWNLIKGIVNKLDIKVKFSSSRITEGFDGGNNPLTGEILIRPSTIKNGRLGEVLVHEIVHALTTKIISRVNSGVTTGLTQKQISAVKGLMKLYKAVKSDNKLENKYPVKDVFEFIAHLTNDNFVAELETKDKSFLQKVVDFITDILGITNANELTKQYLKDIISDGTFLQEQGITVLASDYGGGVQGAKQNTKLEQLKQRLKEVNKKIKAVTKRFDDKIAKLRAVEDKDTTTTTEGTKVPGTKIGTKSDIERRTTKVISSKIVEKGNRKGQTETVTQTNYTEDVEGTLVSVTEYEAKIGDTKVTLGGRRMTFKEFKEEFPLDEDYEEILGDWPDLNDDTIITVRKVKRTPSSSRFKTVVSIFSPVLGDKMDIAIKKDDTKYDAELAALEQDIETEDEVPDTEVDTETDEVPESVVFYRKLKAAKTYTEAKALIDSNPAYPGIQASIDAVLKKLESTKTYEEKKADFEKAVKLPNEFFFAAKAFSDKSKFKQETKAGKAEHDALTALFTPEGKATKAGYTLVRDKKGLGASKIKYKVMSPNGTAVKYKSFPAKLIDVVDGKIQIFGRLMGVEEARPFMTDFEYDPNGEHDDWNGLSNEQLASAVAWLNKGRLDKYVVQHMLGVIAQWLNDGMVRQVNSHVLGIPIADHSAYKQGSKEIEAEVEAMTDEEVENSPEFATFEALTEEEKQQIYDQIESTLDFETESYDYEEEDVAGEPEDEESTEAGQPEIVEPEIVIAPEVRAWAFNIEELTDEPLTQAELEEIQAVMFPEGVPEVTPSDTIKKGTKIRKEFDDRLGNIFPPMKSSADELEASNLSVKISAIINELSKDSFSQSDISAKTQELHSLIADVEANLGDPNEKIREPLYEGEIVDSKQDLLDRIKDGLVRAEEFLKDPSIDKGGNKLNFSEVKPGVSELFETNTKLASIGTQEQYSQWLNYILTKGKFSGSQVDAVVYHVNKVGSVTPIEGKAFHTTSAGYWLVELEEMRGTRIPMLINIQNPTTLDEDMEFTSNAKKFRDAGLGDEFITPDEARKAGTDSVIGRDSGQGRDEKTYITYHPNQVHTLGGKEDIEGFKKFVEQPIQNDENLKDISFEHLDSNKTEDNYDIFYKKVKIGILTVNNLGYIDNIEIDKEYRNKGLGKSIHRKVNSDLLNGKLKSDSQGRNSADEIRVWESLVKSGEAEKTKNGWKFVEQPTAPKSGAVEAAIKAELPIEIANAVTVLEDVPADILGRDDLFLSLKDILNENGITDEMLINWAGANRSKTGNIKGYKSAEQLTKVIENSLNELKKEDKYPELKVNPLALESFHKWVKALEKYPAAFQEMMLTHAIKYLRKPDRKSKYVLQLSEVALTATHGLVVNKPHELNRVGKLYDSEVLKTVSDAVGHEPSASGKGYWVHIPRTAQTDYRIELQRDSGYYGIFRGDTFLDEYSTRLKAQEEAEKLRKENSNSTTHKVNVEMLRKLSPSTWCTASGMAAHYVENYDNYLLIVDGVTVAGIEARPRADNSKKIQEIESKIIDLENTESYTIDRNRIKGQPSTFTSVIRPFKGDIIYLRTNDREEINAQEEDAIKKINEDLQTEIKYLEVKLRNLSEETELIEVKEVTSRNNNGVASIDHLDDTIAFFKKHNLDLNNSTIQSAINKRNVGKKDTDFQEEDGDIYGQNPGGRYDEDRGWEEPEYDPGEYLAEQEADYRAEELARGEVADIGTVEGALTQNNAMRYFEELKPELQNNEQVATIAVETDAHNIAFIDPKMPFYMALVRKALEKNGTVYSYLPEEVRQITEIKESNDEYFRQIREATDREEARIAALTPEEQAAERYANGIDLPFSKTSSNQIQGYYDAKNDKVVVIAANTPVNEAAKVAIHEVAHRGMLRMAKDLGGTKELNAVLLSAEKELMKKVPELLKRTGHKNLEDLMLDYGFDASSEEGKMKLLSELAARWAESLVGKPRPSWWKEFLQSIKDWVKKFTGVVLNENEVDELVGGFVKYGTKEDHKDDFDKAEAEIAAEKAADTAARELELAKIKQAVKDTKLTKAEKKVIADVAAANGESDVEAFVRNAAVAESSGTPLKLKGEAGLLSKFAAIIKKILNKLLLLAVVVNLFMGEYSFVAPPTSRISNVSEIQIPAEIEDENQLVKETFAVISEKYPNESIVVLDKATAKVFVTDSAGKVIYEGPAVFGSTVGDTMDMNLQINSYGSLDEANQRITPAGEFTLTKAADKEYGGGSKFNLQGTKRGGGKPMMNAFHAMVITPERNAALASKTPTDNGVTYGCISIAKDDMARISPQMSKRSHMVIIPGGEGRKAYKEYVRNIASRTVKYSDWLAAAAPVKEEKKAPEKTPVKAPMTAGIDALALGALLALRKNKGAKANPEIKKGVPELFEADPKLANAVYEALGFEIPKITSEQKQQAQQLYSQWLDTVHPKSAVNDVLFHGSQKKITKFSKDLLGVSTKAESAQLGFFFTNVYEAAESYTSKYDVSSALGTGWEGAVTNLLNYYDTIGWRKQEEFEKEVGLEVRFIEAIKSENDLKALRDKLKAFPTSKIANTLAGIVNHGVDIENTVHRVILDIRKPETSNFEGMTLRSTKAGLLEGITDSIKNKKPTTDGLILKNTVDPIPMDTYIVFEPKQIHILGGNEDIEGFKGFVKDLGADNKPDVDTALEKRSGVVAMLAKSLANRKLDKARTRRDSGDRDLKQALIDAGAPQALIDSTSSHTLLVEGVLADNNKIMDSLMGLGGYFDPATDTVYTGKLYGALLGKENLLIHEAVHAATIMTYHAVLFRPEEFSKEQVQAVKDLGDIADDYRSNTSITSKLIFPNLYGTHNVYEFMAEFIANKNFREYVGKVSPDKKVNFINYIWDKILRLLGLKPSQINQERIDKIAEAIDRLFSANIQESKRRDKINKILKSADEVSGKRLSLPTEQEVEQRKKECNG